MFEGLLHLPQEAQQEVRTSNAKVLVKNFIRVRYPLQQEATVCFC